MKIKRKKRRRAHHQFFIFSYKRDEERGLAPSSFICGPLTPALKAGGHRCERRQEQKMTTPASVSYGRRQLFCSCGPGPEAQAGLQAGRPHLSSPPFSFGKEKEDVEKRPQAHYWPEAPGPQDQASSGSWKRRRARTADESWRPQA